MPATEMEMPSLPSLLLPLVLGLLLGLHPAHANVIDEKCRECIYAVSGVLALDGRFCAELFDYIGYV